MEKGRFFCPGAERPIQGSFSLGVKDYEFRLVPDEEDPGHRSIDRKTMFPFSDSFVEEGKVFNHLVGEGEPRPRYRDI